MLPREAVTRMGSQLEKAEDTSVERIVRRDGHIGFTHDRDVRFGPDVVHESTTHPIRLHENGTLDPTLDRLHLLEDLDDDVESVFLFHFSSLGRDWIEECCVAGKGFVRGTDPVIVPLPSVECFCRQGEVFEDRAIAKDAIDRVDHIVTGSPRDIEVPSHNALFVLIVVTVDIAKQRRVAASPGIDRLLDISDLEKRPFAGGVLYRLIDQVGDDFPLQRAGVLEFVEKPVVVAGIESVIDAEPVIFSRNLAEQGSRGSVAGRHSCEKQGKVLEGKATLSSNSFGIGRLVSIQEVPDSLGPAEASLDFVAHQVLKNTDEENALPGTQFVLLAVEGNRHLSGLEIRPVG